MPWKVRPHLRTSAIRTGRGSNPLNPRPLPLQGITVIDLSHIYNGPYATFMMAMAGARVIKIEPPKGEWTRRRGVLGGSAMAFAMFNANKDCVTLNLKSEAGKRLFFEMVIRSDVVVENFAPGAVERLGIDADTVLNAHPNIVYASSSGYGHDGPYRDKPAMDLTVQAMSGIVSVTGHPHTPPVKAGAAVCDLMAGAHLYGAIMTALFERERTGLGRRVEVSMMEASYASLASNLDKWWSSGGEAPERTGSRHGALMEAPWNVYPTRDGWIAVICLEDRHWTDLLQAMSRNDLIDDPRFTDQRTRVEHMDEVDSIVEAFTSQHSKAELDVIFREYHAIVAPVRNLAELTSDPHLRARGFLREVDHPEYGRMTLPISPLRFAGSQPPQHMCNGKLGVANREVYCNWLGLSRTEFERLDAEGTFSAS